MYMTREAIDLARRILLRDYKGLEELTDFSVRAYMEKFIGSELIRLQENEHLHYPRPTLPDELQAEWEARKAAESLSKWERKYPQRQIGIG